MHVSLNTMIKSFASSLLKYANLQPKLFCFHGDMFFGLNPWMFRGHNSRSSLKVNSGKVHPPMELFSWKCKTQYFIRYEMVHCKFPFTVMEMALIIQFIDPSQFDWSISAKFGPTKFNCPSAISIFSSPNFKNFLCKCGECAPFCAYAFLSTSIKIDSTMEVLQPRHWSCCKLSTVLCRCLTYLISIEINCIS